ncbi:MAG: tRNA epoxyqueuosine(34) reductase QueG [Bacteroidota bacterium]|nr:tRNA epoxyqueuosine(34) reductase QueG [Bacteroidota bacterium]
MSITKNTDIVKSLAQKVGFDLVGITSPEIPKTDQYKYTNWLSNGFAANMGYLHRNIDLRTNPENLFNGVKSILVLGLSYYPADKPKLPYKISKYAYGRDYHKLIKSRGKLLQKELRAFFPDLKSRIFVDSAPVMERSLAVQAGFGWIGKNTCLINRKKGSFLFLASLFLNIELNADSPFVNSFCGNCTKCIDACPTNALSEAGLDANRCISYHTIETQESIPNEILQNMDNQLFGCDICQDVCPWNQKLSAHTEPDFFPGNHLILLNEPELENMSQEDFRTQFAGTPFLRTGKAKLLQTIKQHLQYNTK